MMRALLRRLHPVAEQLGFYTSYQLQEAEYIGVSDASDSREQLRSRGYERVPRLLGIPLQATKTHPASGSDHDWALRKVDDSDPQMQFHVHAWRQPEGTEIYSHWEYRPDLRQLDCETHSMRKERLRTHYRPIYGRDYVQGKSDATVNDLVKG
jgi:hypothetical protein